MKTFILAVAASLASVVLSAPAPQWGFNTPFGGASTGPNGATLSSPFGSITLTPPGAGNNNNQPPPPSQTPWRGNGPSGPGNNNNQPPPQSPWRGNGWYTDAEAEVAEEASEVAETEALAETSEQ